MTKDCSCDCKKKKNRDTDEDPSSPPGPRTDEVYRTVNIPIRFMYPKLLKGYREVDGSNPHPCYRSTSTDYGWFSPTIHTVPTTYYPRNGSFSLELSRGELIVTFNLFSNTMLGLSLNLLSNYHNDHFEWNVENQRKHWLLSKHCNNVLFAKSLRNLPLISLEAKFYWHRYVSNKKYNKWFEKDLRNLLNSSLLKAYSRQNISAEHIIVSEQLINLDKYDPLTRRNFIEMTVNFIRNQSLLEIVCLEGLNLTENEISDILSALVWSNKCIKFLLLWRVFKCHARPSLMAQIADVKGFDIAYYYLLPKWLQAITSMKYLESISLNYTYIASETGEELIFMAKSIKKSWKFLQLLCLEDEVTATIPDCAWNEARKWSPKLRVQLIFLGISKYDQHKKFLTQSIPIQALYLSTNLRLLSHYPCMLDCTLKTVYRWYHRHLVQLYLNLWNVQETFDNHLRKILPCLPNLETFEFLGLLRDVVTIHTMCCQIKLGVCAVKNVDMRLQKINKFDTSDSAWLSQLECVLEPFKPDFDAAGVSFGIRTYPC